ncbi:glycine/betaine ABC transporter permease, partial [Mesorhizobium sp. M2E.F.Ca.ET.209.01.1.1]
MAYYAGLFDQLGLRGWCDASDSTGPMSMAELLKKSKEANAGGQATESVPFPSLDALHDAC